jgi:hypothetical protein
MNSNHQSPVNNNPAKDDLRSLRNKAKWVAAIGLVATAAATFFAATSPITAVM